MKGIRFVAFALVMLLAVSSGIAFAEQSKPADEAGPLSAALEESEGVEIPTKRTATSETFRLSGGELETRVFDSPINYKDSSGEWQPIDESLTPSQGGGFENGGNRFDVHLPERIGSSPVRLSVGEDWISYEFLGATSEEAEVNENSATYESSGAGPDFGLSSLPTGIKEDVRVANPAEADNLRFALSMSEGIEPVLTGSGSIAFRREDGSQVAELPAPFMYDSATVPHTSEAVHYELEEDGGSWVLVVKADQGWLEGADRAWPVTIDPSILTNNPTQNCFYLGTSTGGSPFTYCSSSILNVGFQNMGSEDWYARALLRFDVSAIPSAAWVKEATLGLYTKQAVSNVSGIETRQATRNWTEGVTWSRYDGSNLWTTAGGDYTTSGAEILTSERGSQAGWWTFGKGMTSLVQGWVSGATPNQGVLVKLLDDKTSCGSGCVRMVQFQSKTTTNSAERPYLKVSYYPAAPSTSKVVSPSEGTRTAKRFKLKSRWTVSGVTGVSYQFREKGSTTFETIPTSFVQDAKGQQVTWPVATSGKESPPLFFDAAHALPMGKYQPQGGPIEIRAIFEGPTKIEGYSAPVNATVDRYVGGTRDATASVGPGSVNLLTGNFTVSRTDVSIPGFGSALTFSRTHSSRNSVTSFFGVLGQGWIPSVPVEAQGGASWRSAFDASAAGEGAYAVLTDLEGYEYAFELAEGKYVTPPEMPGWQLLREDATHLALIDSAGSRTVFEQTAGTFEYKPTSISQAGGPGNKTQLVYELPAGGSKRLKMIIGPAAPGLECTPSTALTTVGCRSLLFNYLPAKNWGGFDYYGDRLSTITYYGPTSPSTMSHWDVAQYSYNEQGRLVAEWDPRISPALKETYGASRTFPRMRPPSSRPTKCRAARRAAMRERRSTTWTPKASSSTRRLLRAPEPLRPRSLRPNRMNTAT